MKQTKCRKIPVFQIVMPYSLLKVYWCFRRSYYLQHQDRYWRQQDPLNISTLHQPVQHHILEKSDLRGYWCEYLSSQTNAIIWTLICFWVMSMQNELCWRCFKRAGFPPSHKQKERQYSTHLHSINNKRVNNIKESPSNP